VVCSNNFSIFNIAPFPRYCHIYSVRVCNLLFSTNISWAASAARTWDARSVVCVSVCELVTRVSCAKNSWTDGDAFYGADSCWYNEPWITWGFQVPTGKGTFEKGHVQAVVTYLRMLEYIAHCSPATACGGRMYSPQQGVTSRRCGLLPNYFEHLFL